MDLCFFESLIPSLAEFPKSNTFPYKLGSSTIFFVSTLLFLFVLFLFGVLRVITFSGRNGR